MKTWGRQSSFILWLSLSKFGYYRIKFGTSKEKRAIADKPKLGSVFNVSFHF
ncbi:hypothetical protein H6G36_23685 [Anabaena minutissima FACHB-250]|nr:hypothetical protein [Anabaena minutissima FACHB-250]